MCVGVGESLCGDASGVGDDIGADEGGVLVAVVYGAEEVTGAAGEVCDVDVVVVVRDAVDCEGGEEGGDGGEGVEGREEFAVGDEPPGDVFARDGGHEGSIAWNTYPLTFDSWRTHHGE